MWLQSENNNNVTSSQIPGCRSAISSLFTLVFTWCPINSLKVTSIIKFWDKDNPSHAKYLQMWDASLLLKYYITTCLVEPEDEFFEFLQFLLWKTISFIAFFCLLRPIEII
jgi:hypothetical protein